METAKKLKKIKMEFRLGVCAVAGLVLVCISGCSSPVKTAYSAPGLTESPPATAISIPSATPAAESVGLDCQEKFEQRALSGSSADGQAGGDPRQTMSAEDLSSSLVQMGIEKICLPTSLGAPFVAVDWDESQGTSEVGRMFSIGFEELYDGAGWGAGYLVYGEYAFSAGTEYEVFGREGDFQSLQGELPAGASEINGKTMLQKAVRSEICFGRCAAYLVYLFPFESHYLAAVMELGYYDFDADWTSILGKIEAGQVDEGQAARIKAFEEMVQTVQFIN